MHCQERKGWSMDKNMACSDEKTMERHCLTLHARMQPKIRALARANMAAPKTPAHGSTLAQDGSRCDGQGGHKELRAKAQSLCAGSE